MGNQNTLTSPIVTAKSALGKCGKCKETAMFDEGLKVFFEHSTTQITYFERGIEKVKSDVPTTTCTVVRFDKEKERSNREALRAARTEGKSIEVESSVTEILGTATVRLHRKDQYNRRVARGYAFKAATSDIDPETKKFLFDNRTFRMK